jgi:hypothetical protein
MRGLHHAFMGYITFASGVPKPSWIDNMIFMAVEGTNRTDEHFHFENLCAGCTIESTAIWELL